MYPVEPWLDRAVEIAKDGGGTVAARRSRDEGGADASRSWRSAFLRMPYQRDALARRSVIVETFETACTWAGFAELDAAVRAAATAALADVCGGGLVTCRFTHVYPDGPAPYYGVYAAGRWPDTVAQWDAVKAAVSDVLDRRQATITHHHAVGRDHRRWYDRQRPDPFAAAMVAAKGALDPAGILNPGV
ncbi:MAG: FAD-binding oxidoreductase, partial [Pseudonocardia sp.]|nr:FAD-binding oxidoreductase [Pseudonocardia sp.]